MLIDLKHVIVNVDEQVIQVSDKINFQLLYRILADTFDEPEYIHLTWPVFDFSCVFPKPTNYRYRIAGSKNSIGYRISLLPGWRLEVMEVKD